MIASLAVTVLATLAAQRPDPVTLPVCSNRVINEVVKRSGCLLGDRRCWSRAGGFCMDYVEKRVGPPPKGQQLRRLEAAEVRPGDVAVFTVRAHYAYVEKVSRGGDGRPTAVDLAEYNHGSCWVDPDAGVTDRYLLLSRRAGVAVDQVDGGFLGLRPAGG